MAVEVVKQAGNYNRYKVLWEGRAMAALNLDSEDPSFALARPTLHPLYTPEGFPLTEHGAHNLPHQRGVWLGHGSVNGVDCYLDRPGGGRIVVKRVDVRAIDDGVEVDLLNHWLDPAGRPLLVEERRCAFVPLFGSGQPWALGRPQAHLIEITSRLKAEFGRIVLAKHNHAYFGARVLDAIDEDDGGVLRSSTGSVGAVEISGAPADWVDCSGAVGGHRVGLTVMVHPSVAPQPILARGYGVILANHFATRSVTLKLGQEFTQTFGVLAHDGGADEFDVAAAYADFGSRPTPSAPQSAPRSSPSKQREGRLKTGTSSH